jgi:phosphoenolpyruvate-protein phosphotransferase (PTS system enzyme I)
MNKGVPVSPGVAVARAHCVQTFQAPRGSAAPLDAAALSGEVRRFERALSAAARDLDETIARVARQVNEDAAAIFRAHRLLLRDPTLTQKVTAVIRARKVEAAAALSVVITDYQRLLERIPDPVLRGRMDDLRDVAHRILGHLALEAPVADPAHELNEPVILVAEEILPSQALTLDRRLIAGIATEKGGPTGHAAILARSLGIPAVSGLRGLLREVRCGQLIALDGREGIVHVDPGPEAEAAYRKLQREYVALYDKLIENRDSPAASADGVGLELLANVNSVADARLAVAAGAAGVGLYRTEYLFLSHPSVPDEEDQFRAYREVIEASPNRTVTVRTLDLGGDKHVPYLGTEDEPNPFMGFRSIRLSSAYPEFFATQLRAILRAAQYGRVSLLFPMVSTLEEVREARKAVLKTLVALQRAGVNHGDGVPLGIMVEVPAAAVCIEELLREVDFVSIGSNDLVQYLMAADRDNPKVAHLCEPFGPALLRVLAKVIKACCDQGKPVTLCGEMAGRPRCFLPLLGMGLRKLSMSPAFVPTIKEVGRHTTLAEATLVAQRVLRMTTAREVSAYLANKLQQVWPSMQLLDLRR